MGVAELVDGVAVMAGPAVAVATGSSVELEGGGGG